MPRPTPPVWYETSSGEAIRLSGGASWLYSIDAHGWERTADGSSATLEARDLSGTLSFGRGASREECDRLLALAWADMDSGEPGCLRVGEWRMRCYLLKLEPSLVTGDNASFSVTLHAPEPIWRRETTYQLLPNSGREMENETLDYPHDYAHDFGTSSVSGVTIDVPGVSPCDVRIRVYGHAVAPYVRIGANTYQVNVTVPDGAILTVDTTRKGSMLGDSVTLRGRYGDVQDVFAKRLRGAEGSGSYIYELVPPGPQVVSWPQSFGVDVTLIERRGALPWTSF